MSNITNTERVAVALFGWTNTNAPGMLPSVNRYYSHPSYCGFVMVNENTIYQDWLREGEFPDFADERLSPYWCDRMQRELAGRGHSAVYAMWLYRIRQAQSLGLAVEQVPPLDSSLPWASCLLATPAQRLEAAVRVLDEAEKAEKTKDITERQAQEKQAAYRKALRDKVAELRTRMSCNCDLDNWQPEESTGHSWVCRIHKSAVEAIRFDDIRVLDEVGL